MNSNLTLTLTTFKGETFSNPLTVLASQSTYGTYIYATTGSFIYSYFTNFYDGLSVYGGAIMISGNVTATFD